MNEVYSTWPNQLQACSHFSSCKTLVIIAILDAWTACILFRSYIFSQEKVRCVGLILK